MKRLLFICMGLLLVQCICAITHTYSDHSVLKDGNIIKIRVAESGIHAISYDTLQAWGLKPDAVRVLGYGGEVLTENFNKPHHDDLPSVAFYMHKGADEIFNKGDYILFYAQATTGWNCRADGTWSHTRNPYSDYGYYFVSDDAGEQRLIELSDMPPAIESSSVMDVDWYMYHGVHEEDKINMIDKTGVSGGGREFYGELITSRESTLELSFPTAHVRTDVEAICRVHLAGSTGEATKIKVEYGNNSATSTVKPINVSDFYTKAEIDSLTMFARPVSSGNQKVKLQFISGPQTANVYLNYVVLNVPCQLTMTGDVMLITNTSYLGDTPYMRFHLSGATSETQIWRITDGVNIEQMPTTMKDGILTWVGNNTSAERYMAINPQGSNWKKVTSLGKVASQDLHSLSNIDYVIICPPEFVAPATRLAKKHEEKDGLTWAVLTDEQVYNEFSSGTPDATAYRWVMKMLYDRAGGLKIKQPKSLLLMGDGTFDNRGLLPRSGINTLLTYQAQNSTVETMAYATDDYFAFMANNAGISNGLFNDVRAQMNFGVGRLPVNTIDEANAVVDKLCTYMDDLVLGKWKSQILFMADDGDHGLHVQTADGGAEKIRKENKDFIVNKIYLDAYTQEVSAAGESYPLAKNQYDNLMSTGVLFMDYSGHGGYNNITNELFMKSADIQKMTNANQGFWFMATCSFAHFDGAITSAAEEAVLNPHGGAIGVLAACRTVYATQNTILNRNLCDTLFGHKNVFNYNMTLGEATRIGRTSRGSNIVNLLQLQDGEKVTTMLRQPAGSTEGYLTMITRNGLIKRTPLAEYQNIRKGGLNAVSLYEGDALAWTHITGGEDELVVATRDGLAIRFNEADARSVGRNSHGVKAITLGEGDYVVGAGLCRSGATVFTVTEGGKGRRSRVEDYRLQTRGGKGVRNYGAGCVAGVKILDEQDDVILISQEGVLIRMHASDINIQSRYGSGVRVMRLDESDRVMTVARTERAEDVETAKPEEPEEGEVEVVIPGDEE